jgi:hypothetical protein
MTLPWPRILSTAVDLAGPFVLLAWAWPRCARDPHRASLPWWRNLLVLLALLLASAGAVMFALRAAWRLRPGLLDGYLDLWSRPFLMSTLYVLVAGLVLSIVFARGLLRFLVAVACLWMTVRCLVACCGLAEHIQVWLDRLSAM